MCFVLERKGGQYEFALSPRNDEFLQALRTWEISRTIIKIVGSTKLANKHTWDHKVIYRFHMLAECCRRAEGSAQRTGNPRRRAL
jgi:hypothetical protein